MRHRLALPWILAAGLALPSGAALADTVDTGIGAGIGTSVDDVFNDGSGVAVRTSVTSVTYEAPRHVVAQGLAYREVKGTVLRDLFGVEIHADGDRMAPVVGAMVDHVREWIARGTPPPPSRINARAVDADGDGAPDAIAFAQAGGASTSAAPLVADPALDVFAGFRVEVTAAAGEGGLVRRFDEVLRGTGTVAEPVDLPSTRCRRGGYVLAADSRLVPFADLEERWPHPGLYEACVADAVNALDAAGLYDRRLAR